MSWSNWLSVVSICILGAMSPGPSLAVVVKNTLDGSRFQGLMTAVGHGLGVGLYAMLCITGLALLITQSEWLFVSIQIVGALYLIWIGYHSLRAHQSQAVHSRQENDNPPDGLAGFRSGFLIAFLNPKIALFFIALFSQFISPDSPVLEKILYASTAATIDGLWYVLVVLLFSHSLWLDRLKQHGIWLDRLFGVILLLVAVRLLWQIVLL